MNRTMRCALGGAAAAALAWLTGCGNFFVYPGTLPSSTASGNVVYVANGATDTVSGFGIGTGTLTAVTNSPYALSLSPTALAVTPGNTFLYVGGTSAIYAYSIGTGGVLTAVGAGAAAALANVAAMDISPDGQWLFALDGNGLTVDEFQINTTTGVLSQAAGATYSLSGGTVVPRAIKVAPNGAYVFAALGTGGDVVFSFNTSTGALTASQQLAPVSTTTSENALAVNPASTTLYIARSGTSGGVAEYTIGAGGALTAVSGSPFTAGTQPYSIVLDTAGANVYVANRGDNTISAFGIGTAGALTALSGSPYASGASVTALAAESTGKYLLAAANGGGPDLTMYSFDSTTAGKLDPSTTAATGSDPTGPVAIAVTH